MPIKILLYLTEVQIFDTTLHHITSSVAFYSYSWTFGRGTTLLLSRKTHVTRCVRVCLRLLVCKCTQWIIVMSCIRFIPLLDRGSFLFMRGALPHTPSPLWTQIDNIREQTHTEPTRLLTRGHMITFCSRSHKDKFINRREWNNDGCACWLARIWRNFRTRRLALSVLMQLI